ncbi:methyl-accepting chemotaxis protein signaling domain protein [Candidatus Moduliflexus flocculans]|uniref:Methyl-accepting chemotaxis protein signaling domain protein n=1 Tax=Candidatus Moduliflexus flocculans TaxID=1499966 RepID=A0A0S6VQC5_9BACT|nr:methyl-accepting chemotaxis protein signaling domain protein [Candidatus Moduliflexus flocculans]
MKRGSIVTKITASACGLMALLILADEAFLVWLVIQRERKIVADFSAQTETALAHQEQAAETMLIKNVEFSATILSQSGAGDLYNFRTDDLQNMLKSYLAYPEIVAIIALNELGEPFAAAWKTPDFEIATGETVPENIALNKELSIQADSLYDGQKVGQFQVFYINTLIRDQMRQLREVSNKELETAAAASRLRLKNAIISQSLVVAAILLVLMLSLIILLRGLIRRPLLTVTSVAQQLTNLDLTVNITSSQRDEIGELLTSIHHMIEAFRSVISKVQRFGLHVMSSSTELSATAKEQEATMTMQMGSVRNVLHAMDEIVAVLNNLVQTMQHVSSKSEQTAEFANQGQTDLVHLGEVMQRMELVSNTISGRLKTIREKADNITTVVTTITKVADQTNLLSLNAAIEAEKAGELGRGFTVLASEIRRLADQTAIATLDIEQTVQEMRSAVSTGVSEMEHFMAEVRHSVADVDNIMGQLNRIIEQVKALSPDFEAVNISMTQQSQNASDVNQAMLRLSEELHQTAESFRETYLAIEQITTAARELRKETDRFKTNMNSG